MTVTTTTSDYEGWVSGSRRRDRPWFDVPIAATLAVIMINLHVSSAGDALSSLERSDRRGFYALVAVLSVVMLAGTLGRALPAARWCQGCLGLAATASLTGILLDVQDGPVRSVQLFVLFGVFLAAAATVRLIKGSNTQGSGADSSK
jgi:hypothetical protein